MKKLILIMLPTFVVIALIAGCKENPVEEYGMGITNAYIDTGKKMQRVSTENIQKSVDAYRASEGRFPLGLSELSAFMGIELSPEQYDYDPETGRVTLRQAQP